LLARIYTHKKSSYLEKSGKILTFTHGVIIFVMKFKRLGLILGLTLTSLAISLLNQKEVQAHCRVWHPHHCTIEEVVDDVTKTVDRWGLAVANPSLATVPAYLESLYQQGNGRWRNLPDDFKACYRSHYGISLDEVKYATNINTGHGQGITVGKDIYSPTDINLSNRNDRHWMLHELEHVRQYQVVGGVSAFMVKYGVQGSMQIARNGSFNIHDNIELEKEADAKADRIVGLCEVNKALVEFFPPNTDNVLKETIESSYREAFGRNPSQDEINHWVGRSKQETVSMDILMSNHRGWLKSGGDLDETIVRSYREIGIERKAGHFRAPIA
jgi:Domain of unknown function (DUF4157)